MDKHCVGCKYTLLEVIENFQSNHDRVACVLNTDNQIIGVVSQGDIIRALSESISLYATVDKIIKPHFLYLKERNMEEAYSIFKKRGITMLPIVDDNYHLKDVIIQNDIYEFLEQRGEKL